MSLVQRMLRAAKLDVNLYEEVEADKGATGQALLVVVLTSVAAGIGNISSGGITGLLSGTVFGIVSWVVWAYANYLLGAKLFKEPQTEANWGQLARTMGFASAPRIIMVLGLLPIPVFRGLVFLVATVWMWIAMVIAVRQALDYKSTWRAVGVTLLGAVINGVILAIALLITRGAP